MSRIRAALLFCIMTITATPTTTLATGPTSHPVPAPARAPARTRSIQFAWFEYQGAETRQSQVGPDEFLNPIMPGFYPDPSVCRVGEEFFLVNSTFAWFPGVPIFRSKDLVNWTQIGHVLDRPSQLNLDGLGVSEGIFAPTIQYHDGTFYVLTTMVGGSDGGNFYVTARDPAGPWSEPRRLKDVDGIDPSLFFDDDGRVYVAHNGPPPERKPLYDGHRAIWLHEFDLASGSTRAGSAKIIVNGGTDLARRPVWVEAPHLYKRGGFYYLLAAEGGTGPAHSVVVFRSRDIWGPYVPFERPILTQRHLPATRFAPVTCTGHADLIETQTGEWWAVFLGSRPYEKTLTNIGRETFLLPVRWEDDGWPAILSGDEAVPRVLKRPDLPAQTPAATPHNGSFTWRDEFDAEKLHPSWNFLRTPRESWHALDRKRGGLLIEPRPIDLNSRDNPSLIARRQQHARFSASTMMSISDDRRVNAGLVAFQNETHYFFAGVRMGADDRHEIFLERSAGKRSPRGGEIVARAPLPAQLDAIELKVAASGRSYSFSYRVGGGDWTELAAHVDGSILSTDVAGGFVGSYVGIFVRTRE